MVTVETNPAGIITASSETSAVVASLHRSDGQLFVDGVDFHGHLLATDYEALKQLSPALGGIAVNEQTVLIVDTIFPVHRDTIATFGQPSTIVGSYRRGACHKLGLKQNNRSISAIVATVATRLTEAGTITYPPDNVVSEETPLLVPDDAETVSYLSYYSRLLTERQIASNQRASMPGYRTNYSRFMRRTGLESPADLLLRAFVDSQVAIQRGKNNA